MALLLSVLAMLLDTVGFKDYEDVVISYFSQTQILSQF